MRLTPNFLTSTALLLFALFTARIVSAAETTIDRLEHYNEAIVTVKGRIIELFSDEQNVTGLDAATGQTFADERRRARITENTGAGVILTPDGVIATNTHIIYDSQEIWITLDNGREFPAQVLFVSPRYDFSLVKVNAGRSLKTVKWANSGRIALGQEIITIGRSPLLNKTLSGGTIEAIGVRHDNPDDPEFLQINVNHYPGDSGGPVFDREGRFLGLMNAKRMTKNRAGLAIPAQKILSAYRALKSPRNSR